MILAQSLGLLIGAIFWSIGCDVWGRRQDFLCLAFELSFNTPTGGPSISPSLSHPFSPSLLPPRPTILFYVRTFS